MYNINFNFINKLVFLALIAFMTILIYIGYGMDFKTKMVDVQETGSYKPRYVENIEVKNYDIVGKVSSYYDKAPTRAFVVGENIIETFVALGVEDSIICPVVYGSRYFEPEPEYANGYNKLDKRRFNIVNMETVLSIRPDLIVGGQVIFSDKSLKGTRFWNERNVHTFCSLNANSPKNREYKETLEQEMEFILGLGKIFDKEQRAQKIVNTMNDSIEIIRKHVVRLPKPKVLIVEQLGGSIVVYGKNKLAGNICEKLGADVLDFPGGTIGWEDIIQANPDAIFVVKSGGDPEAAANIFRHKEGLQNLHCIKEQRVYGIALNYTYNSAVKTSIGIKKFAAGLYPSISGKLRGDDYE